MPDELARHPTEFCNECGYPHVVLIQVVVTRKPETGEPYTGIEHWCRECLDEETGG